MKNLFILILLFFIYSFIGWLLEVILTIIEDKKLINRGFMIGPLCPIYGVGGSLILLLLNKYANDPITLFIMAVVICSSLEYFTSWLMELIFKNRWWDYSNKKFNLNGRICLEYAIPFGLGASFMFYVLNPVIFKFLNFFSLPTLKIVSVILLVIFILDFALSFNIILGLKNISNSIICDSTEAITKKVREIISHKDFLYKRLVNSFPNMKIFNKMYLLKRKLEREKDKVKLEKEKIKTTKKETKKKLKNKS